MSFPIEDLIRQAAYAGAHDAVTHALADVTKHGSGPLLLNYKAVASALSCSPSRATELMKAGVLGPMFDGPGNGRVVTRANVAAYVERLAAQAARRPGALEAA